MLHAGMHNSEQSVPYGLASHNTSVELSIGSTGKRLSLLLFERYISTKSSAGDGKGAEG